MYLNSYIDHTNLKPYATLNDIKKLCDEAIKYHFQAVCVSPIYVKHCKELLKNTPVNVCTVIGFPLGYNTTATKEFEAIEAVKLCNTKYGHPEIHLMVAGDGPLINECISCKTANIHLLGKLSFEQIVFLLSNSISINLSFTEPSSLRL